MGRYRVVAVRDLSQEWYEPDADRVVHAATAHAAAREVLRSLGSGFADFIEVRAYAPQSSRVRYLYCNLHAGEFTFDLCCVPRNA
jgi:3-deoxy-D-arabino-heptulosonate 7-phosphate (DAHP) synthase class II